MIWTWHACIENFACFSCELRSTKSFIEFLEGFKVFEGDKHKNLVAFIENEEWALCHLWESFYYSLRKKRVVTNFNFDPFRSQFVFCKNSKFFKNLEEYNFRVPKSWFKSRKTKTLKFFDCSTEIYHGITNFHTDKGCILSRYRSFCLFTLHHCPNTAHEVQFKLS